MAIITVMMMIKEICLNKTRSNNNHDIQCIFNFPFKKKFKQSIYSYSRWISFVLIWQVWEGLRRLWVQYYLLTQYWFNIYFSMLAFVRWEHVEEEFSTFYCQLLLFLGKIKVCKTIEQQATWTCVWGKQGTSYVMWMNLLLTEIRQHVKICQCFVESACPFLIDCKQTSLSEKALFTTSVQRHANMNSLTQTHKCTYA